MASFFIMNRTGSFQAIGTQDNQCVRPGNPLYLYTIRMVFEGDVALDRHGFILDHSEVDSIVQGLVLRGSCEQMELHIVAKLRSLMHVKDRPLVACKCTLRADGPHVAWLEHVWAKESKHLIMLGS